MTSNEFHTLVVWGQMDEADLPFVTAAAARIHKNYPEDSEVFANRLHVFPQGCLICRLGADAIGYMVSHPWCSGGSVPLNHMIMQLPADANALYLHDLALLPEVQGSGAGRTAIAAANAIARAIQLDHIELVALPDAVSFWLRMGFEPFAEQPPKIAASYGQGALQMRKPVTQ